MIDCTNCHISRVCIVYQTISNKIYEIETEIIRFGSNLRIDVQECEIDNFIISLTVSVQHSLHKLCKRFKPYGKEKECFGTYDLDKCTDCYCKDQCSARQACELEYD